MRTIIYQGLLAEHDWGDAMDILFLSSIRNPLAEALKQDIANKQVTVRYWITDQQVTKEEATREFLKTVMGAADVDFGSHYSDITGYLWTDEGCKIGGHDLLEELRSYTGKWLLMEIDVHGG